MPPMTAVPSACCAPAPAPLPVTIGTTPRMKASDVIRMGRRRMRAAVMAASTTRIPCALRSLANSTIRMAFLDARPMVVSRPTWKYTSFIFQVRMAPSSAPSTPSGTTMMTEKGIAQLSYSAARHRNTIRIDSV